MKRIHAALDVARPLTNALPDSRLTILAWSNTESLETGMLPKQLGTAGVPHRIIGEDIPSDRWTGQTKLQAIVAALAEVRSPYVAGFDACDVVLLDTPQRLVERFASEFSCRLLFGATRDALPPIPGSLEFEETMTPWEQSPYRYIDSGVWIGHTDFCREFFTAALSMWSADHEATLRTYAERWAPYMNTTIERFWREFDEPVIRKILPSYGGEVVLDTRCSLLQTLNFVRPDDLEILGKSGWRSWL